MDRRLDGAARPPAPGAGSEKTRVEVYPALPPRLMPGDRVGAYRIEGEIARGATASVYAADLRRSGPIALSRDPAALKVLSAHLSVLPRAMERFQREHELARRVRHPSIVRAEERGEARGHAFYAMRRESGRTLADLIDDPARDAAYYQRIAVAFSRVAEALGALHRVGVVHRDVKPENILVGRDGSLILCDFGSALDSSPSGDDRDELWGTVGYMPPEQLRPGADPRDASMDIYALGLCLYEAVTGSPAFPRLSGEALVKLKLTRLPPAPRCMDHRVPLGLEAIIRQAIDSEPRLRHSSAAELAEDLERFASGKRGHRRS